MRKSLLLTIVALVASMAAFAQGEQFVSTTPSNKNVVIEEYTGINCGYCPDGHKIANQVAAAHPGRVFILNIHQGNYAASTYTTQFGNALANQIGLSGYPAGTVNRHLFSQYSDVLDVYRSYWPTCANAILGQSSPVNIAARGTLDWTTRELNITVQLYYTSDEANATNKLNVAILQDNVLGSQSGASLNPDQQVGSQYRHMHMLRHLITGQWGEAVSPTTTGSFIEKTYTYTIPASLGSPNAIAAKLEDLHFVAFVAQGNQEILTGCEVEIEHVNLPALSPRLDQLSQIPLNDCSAEAKVGATVSNVGSSPLTSLTFEYTVANGAPQTYNWTGNIASMSAETIELPNLPINANTNQSVKVKIINANGSAWSGEQVPVTIKKYVAHSDGAVTLKIKGDGYSGSYSTDQGGPYPGEQSFKLYGPNGSVVQSVNYTSFTSNAVNEFPLNISGDGCYRLEVLDAYGDGIQSGYVRLYNEAGSQLVSVSGSTINDKVVIMIAVGEGVSVEDMTFDEDMTVYPNPTSDLVNIQTGLAIQQVEVYNLQGQRVAAEAGNVSNISLNGLANGMYIMKVTTEKGVKTYKISKR